MPRMLSFFAREFNGFHETGDFRRSREPACVFDSLSRRGVAGHASPNIDLELSKTKASRPDSNNSDPQEAVEPAIPKSNPHVTSEPEQKVSPHRDIVRHGTHLPDYVSIVVSLFGSIGRDVG